MRETEKQATIESKEARDAIEAARSIAADPAKRVEPTSVAANDRIGEIRREQAEMLEKLSKERAQTKARGHEVGDWPAARLSTY